MRLVMIIGLLTVGFCAFAQDTAKIKPWHYTGLHQVGLLAGSSEEKFGVLTTNGLQKGNWFAGVSTGIDWYGIRSIPVMGSVYKAFGKNRNQPYLFGSAGVGFAWLPNNITDYYSLKYQNGFAGEAGVGYFINLKNKTALSLSVGYSYKQLRAQEKYRIFYDFPPYSNDDYNISSFKYNYRRIAIRLGIKI